MTKRAGYYRTMYVGNVVQIADDLGHVINPGQDDAPNEEWLTYRMVIVAAVAAVNAQLIRSAAAVVPPVLISVLSLTDRVSMTVMNTGANMIWLDNALRDSTITQTEGWPLAVGAWLTLPLGGALHLYATSIAAGSQLNVIEVGK